jgi:ABC-type sugar transport system permease subunit
MRALPLKPESVQRYTRPKQKSIVFRGEAATAYLLLLPILAFFLIRFYLPILFSLVVSFTRYDLLTGAITYIGIDNYISLFTDYRNLRAITNTFLFVMGEVTGSTVLGLLFALLLDRLPKYSTVFRTIFFMPMVVSIVAVSQVWMWIYHRDIGILNWILTSMGFEKVGWLVNPRYTLMSITIMSIWRQMGYSMVIFLAGLSNIPEHFYEAGKIDGANSVQIMRHITVPLLIHITLLVLVVNTINAFRVFTQVYVMGDAKTFFGGPQNSTLTIVLQIYQLSFVEFRLGAAQAMAMVLLAIVITITVIQRKVLSRYNYEY